MRTVQLTLDEALVRAVDALAKRLGTTRSALARQALRETLERERIEVLERRHRSGYLRKPARKREFNVWESQQTWGDR